MAAAAIERCILLGGSLACTPYGVFLLKLRLDPAHQIANP